MPLSSSTTSRDLQYTSLNDYSRAERNVISKKASTFILIAKLIYFCVGINGACARSFLAIFLKHAELSYISIGIYFAVTSAAIAITTPLFGILIEHTRLFSFFLRLLSVLSVVASIFLLVQFFAYDDTIQSNYSIFHDIKLWLDGILPVSGYNVETKRLWYLTTAGVLLSSFGRASGSVRDSAVMDVCKNSPSNNFTYDRVRGVLSLGMGLSNIGCGAVLVYTNLKDYELWSFSTLALIVLTIFSFPFSSIWELNFKKQTEELAEDEVNGDDNNRASNVNNDISATMCEKMFRLISSYTMIVFLLVSVVNGMGNATYDIYIILRLNQLHASYFLIGVTAGLGSLTNFVFFYITPCIRTKIGNSWMIIISMLAFCVRSWIYSLMNDTNYSIVLIAQSLHGLNFSIMFAGSIGYINEKTRNNGLTVFARAMFGFAFTGIGGIVGNLLGGYLYDIHGAVYMFRVKVYITLIVMILFVISEWTNIFSVQKR